MVKPLRANPTKWPNTLTTIRRLLPTNYLRVFDHFVGLELKGLICLPITHNHPSKPFEKRPCPSLKCLSNIRKNHTKAIGVFQ